MIHRAAYVWIVVLLIFLPLVGLTLSAISFPAYTGVLTRIGGFSEDDFGWQEPQQAFPSPLFTTANSAEEYKRYYDIVVIGDSFSHDQEKGWQNYFVEQTGLSVITFHHGVPLDRVLNAKMFKDNPPLFFVVESLEQYSLSRFAAYNVYGSTVVVGAQSVSTGVVTLVRHEHKKEQIKNYKNLPLEERIGQRRHNLEKAVERYLRPVQWLAGLKQLHGTGDDNDAVSEVYPLPLKERLKLFSNKLDDILLVYGKDLTKVTEGDLLRLAAIGLRRLQDKVEGNGHTRFVLMIFPDKLSVYAPMLEDRTLAPPSLIPTLAQLYPSQVRLDLAFRRAMKKPVVDLYLPNDTHAGFEGYRIAADVLTDYLIANGMAKYH